MYHCISTVKNTSTMIVRSYPSPIQTLATQIVTLLISTMLLSYSLLRLRIQSVNPLMMQLKPKTPTTYLKNSCKMMLKRRFVNSRGLLRNQIILGQIHLTIFSRLIKENDDHMTCSSNVGCSLPVIVSTKVEIQTFQT